MMAFDLFTTKPTCSQLRHGECVESQGFQATLGACVASYFGDILMSAVKYLTPLLATGEKFLVLAAVDGRMM